jgi:hypothetical protein
MNTTDKEMLVYVTEKEYQEEIAPLPILKTTF